MDDLYQAIERCEGCAFREGTAASQSDATQLTAKLCLQAARPFFCHERVHELQRDGLPASVAMEQAKREGNFPVCRGFVDAMSVLDNKGEYTEATAWRRDLANRLLDLMDEVTDNHLTPDEADKRLAEVMRNFVAA
jgi:hypothetical protein